MTPPEVRHRYQEIARRLQQEIARGDFQPSGKLPSERVLGERFGVQRNTVRQALSVLEQQGQIITEGKRGSFVQPTSVVATRKSLLVSIHGDFSPALSRMIDGFTRVAARSGYTVSLYDTHPAEGAALDPIPSVDTMSAEVAGVALWPQNPTDEVALSRLNEAIPLVLVDRRVPGVMADCVRFDDVAGGRTVTEHLIDQGHRRIAFLTDEVFAETVQHRWQGYAAALEAASIPVDPKLSLFFYGIHEPLFSMAMRQMLQQEDAPTAIVCSNDVVAFVLLRFLRDEGIRVPDDVAVTGYGNLMPDYTFAMALTSVDQSFFEMGSAAATILLERIERAAEGGGKPRDVKIPVSLTVKQSSVSSSEN